jgi:dihydrofolate reductase
MRQLIVTEWMSLDGIFDATLMEQWFNPYHSDDRARSIQSTIDNCDAMLYGRVTYDMLYPYWSSLKNNEMGVADKLNKVKKYVVSSTMKQANWENSTIIDKDIISAITKLKQQAGGNILVQGSGRLVRQLLEAGLVDELKLLVQPHIMGSGQRLFPEAMNIGLQCSQVQRLDKGVVLASYKPMKK